MRLSAGVRGWVVAAAAAMLTMSVTPVLAIPEVGGIPDPVLLVPVPGMGASDSPDVFPVDVGTEYVELGWSSAVDPEEPVQPTYRVYEVVGPLTGRRLADTAEENATIAGLQAATPYTFEIRTVDADGTERLPGWRETVTTLDGLPPLHVTPIPGPDPGITRLAAGGQFENGNVAGDFASILTVGGDGTIYELTLAPGSILGAELITMRPLTGLDGFDEYGQFVAGVAFEPDGLVLSEPATLRITPPQPGAVPIAEEMAMISDSGGRNLHLVPIDPGTPDWVFPVSHFSEVVVARGSELSQKEVLEHAKNEEDRINGKIREVLGKERDRQLTGNTEGDREVFENEVAPVYEEMWEKVTKPRLDAAQKNGLLGQSAISGAFQEERGRQLFGFTDDAAAAARQEYRERAIKAILERGFRRAKAACRRTPDVRHMAAMLSFARQGAMLGLNDIGTLDCGPLAEALQVDFRTSTEYVSGSNNNLTVHRQSTSATGRRMNPAYLGPAEPDLFASRNIEWAYDPARFCAVEFGGWGLPFSYSGPGNDDGRLALSVQYRLDPIFRVVKGDILVTVAPYWSYTDNVGVHHSGWVDQPVFRFTSNGGLEDPYYCDYDYEWHGVGALVEGATQQLRRAQGTGSSSHLYFTVPLGGTTSGTYRNESGQTTEYQTELVYIGDYAVTVRAVG